MNDKQRYLFDLQGFLVVDDMLTQDQVKALNQAIDDRQAKDEPITDFLIWQEQIFRDLINLPASQPILKNLLGPGYRLDHEYAIIHQKGDKKLHLHGGGTPFDSGQYYHFQDNKMNTGLLVVSFVLSDINPGDGGFCCIPGSHKANYRLPDIYKNYDEMGPTQHVPVKAGGAIIFTEALTHGTLAWQSDKQRRSLLYKYSPGMIAWRGYNRSPELLDGLTEEQRVILDPPFHPYLKIKDYYKNL